MFDYPIMGDKLDLCNNRFTQTILHSRRTPDQEAAVQEEAAVQAERPETDEEDPEDISADDEAEDIPEEADQEETPTKDEPITWEEYMELRKEYKKVMRNIMDKHRLIDDYVELEKNGTYTQIQMIHNMQWATSAMYKQLDYLMELVDKMKVVRGHAEK